MDKPSTSSLVPQEKDALNETLTNIVIEVLVYKF